MNKMLKFTFIGLIIVALMFSISAAVTPKTTFKLISRLPSVMNVGDTATVIVQVNSDPGYSFVSAMALESAFFPGRGVVARGQDGIDRAGKGSSATLSITFTAIGSTADFPGGVAPVSVVVGANYANGGTDSKAFNFNVKVP